jgi:hypothetical protein
MTAPASTEMPCHCVTDGLVEAADRAGGRDDRAEPERGRLDAGHRAVDVDAFVRGERDVAGLAVRRVRVRVDGDRLRARGAV